MARCDSYYAGQCTWGACEFAGWVPEGLGNGGDWAANAAAQGYTVTDIPTVGAVVCYAAGDGYSGYGHVGVVTAVNGDGTFEVHEMNYVAPYEWDDRQSNNYDVAGFILPPGTAPGQGMGAGGSGSPGGWPAGAQDIIAAYDEWRWYNNVTVDEQIAGLQGTVQLGYQV